MHLQVPLAVAIVILTILYVYVRRSRRRVSAIPAVRSATGTVSLDRDSIVIAGPIGAGKTALYTLWTLGSVSRTVSSLEVGVAPDWRGKAQLLDFPGNAKLRYLLLEQLKEGKVRKVIFVVDSAVASGPELTETAELLADVLSVCEQREKSPEVLIACNKSELFAARPAPRMRRTLEVELGDVLKRRQRSLGSDLRLGNGTFSWDVIETPVEVMSGSVMNSDVDKWLQWCLC